MKKIAYLAAAMLSCATMFGQSSDPVIMKINGKNVTRSEFEYSFNKNNSDGVLDKKTIKEYVPLFVDFKLKVAAAEDAKIDTITSIQKELRGYKEQMVLPTIVDTAFIEREARKTYDNTAARYAGSDLLTASHILVLMRQDATPEAQAAAKVRIDSIYGALRSVPATELEAKFAELAKTCSDDKGSGQKGGALGQFGKGMMIPDFENAAYALKAGEMSAPIKSTVGWHIIYMKDRHPFESYGYHHDNIIKFLEQRGIKEASANMYVDSLARMQNVDREVIIDQLHKAITDNDSEQKYLSQEYYEGTMMYEICKTQIWDKAQMDTAGQTAYFESHRSDYDWDSPRFSGIIIHAKDKATLKKCKKMLKNVKEEDYAQTLANAFNTDSVKLVRIERGLFKQGDNANVDKLVFKVKTAELKPMKDFPETDVYGSKCKNPRTYKDVKNQVVTDYQNATENEWVETLRQKYPVEVYDEVVDTVNKH